MYSIHLYTTTSISVAKMWDWDTGRKNVSPSFDVSLNMKPVELLLRLPVVPHKAVAEFSEEETYRRGWLL